MIYKNSCNFNIYYSMCTYVLVARGEGTERRELFLLKECIQRLKKQATYKTMVCIGVYSDQGKILFTCLGSAQIWENSSCLLSSSYSTEDVGNFHFVDYSILILQQILPIVLSLQMGIPFGHKHHLK